MDDFLYTVSVVVPTYNRADLLKQCIESLVAQNFPKDRFEIIIVDDGSTDNTPDVVKKLQEEISLPVIKHFRQENKGPGAARNAGISLSKGDIIGFTDDDVTVDKDWIRNAISYFTNDMVAGVEGITKLASYENMTLLAENNERGYMTCNIFYRKVILNQIRGFDLSFYGNFHFREDSDLAFTILEKGWKIITARDVLAVHTAIPVDYRNIIGSAKKYYYDPLLYKKHKRLYRAMIEAKKIGPFRFKRPFHYLCFFNVFSVILTIFSLIFFKPFLFVGVGIYILSSMGIIYRFTKGKLLKYPKHIYKIPVYLMTPFIYVYWFIKGCLHFKAIPW